MSWSKSSQSLVALFEEAAPSGPAIGRRKMFGYPAAFAAGHMFIGLFQDDFVARLSPEDRIAFEAEFGARPFEPMPGRPMREYVCLPEEVLEDPEELRGWIARSLRYAFSLPPKPARTKRGRKEVED